MTDANYTHAILVLDSSGSMFNIAPDMNGAVQQFLTEQKALPGKFLVDIFTFETAVKHAFANDDAEHLDTSNLIRPGGGTALLDAIGIAVTEVGTRFESLPEEKRPGKVIVVVVTDGEENSSREWKPASKIKNLVEQQQDKYNWEFLFFGADLNAVNVARDYGFVHGGTYWATAAGVNNVTRSFSAYVSATRMGEETPDDLNLLTSNTEGQKV